MHVIECIIELKKLCHVFRYSARTRIIIEEKCVRIVQRMKNPAARKNSFWRWLPGNQNPGPKIVHRKVR